MRDSTNTLASDYLKLAEPIRQDTISALIESIAHANSLDQATAAVETLFGPYLIKARDLANAVTEDYSSGGQAGTSAYDMLVAYATAEATVTEALVQLVAATVLAKLIQDESGGRSNIEFSPFDMDATFRDYHVEATRDGLTTKISLRPRTEAHETERKIVSVHHPRLMVQDEDTRNAKPQAEPIEERPVWGWRDGRGFHPTSSKAGAREAVLRSVDPIATVENRWCVHKNCPASKCNELTSGIDKAD